MEKVHSIGRRKKSIARVYLVEGTGKFKINGRIKRNENQHS